MSAESREEFGVVSASFLAAKGRTKPMDLLPTESGDNKYLAFLNVGWGMIRYRVLNEIRQRLSCNVM